MFLESFGERLKEAREDVGLTQTSLAKLAKTTEATISRYEAEIHEPSRGTIKKLAEILNVNPAWLLGADVDKWNFGEPDKQDWKRIPVLGSIAAGKPIAAIENIMGYEYVDDNSGTDFCLVVKGDSMTGARLFDGDLVFIRQQQDVENGEIAAVIIDNEEATLKRVYKINGSVILRAENPTYKDLVYTRKEMKEVRILGKAIYFKSRVV